MRLDLDDGYHVAGDGPSVNLYRTRVSGDGKAHEGLIGYYGTFEGALRAYIDITARRDGGAAQILAYLVDAKNAAAEVGKIMDAERRAAKGAA